MKNTLLISLVVSLFLVACKTGPLDTTVPMNSVLKSQLVPLGVWTQKADYIGSLRYDFIGYSLGSKGYIGTGRHRGYFSFLSDFQEFDPVLNSWTIKASLPMSLSGGTGFTAGNKGIVVCGANDRTYVYDTYQYDTLAGVWSTKAFIYIPRQRATGVGNGDFGYVIGGYSGSGSAMNDCWEYYQPLDTWSQRSSLPVSAARYNSTGFSIGGKVYVFGGTAGINLLNDLWQFDTVNNTWTQKTSMPAAARTQSISFVINNLAYIIGGYNYSGYLTECWKYDPSLDQWTSLPDFPGIKGPAGGVGFTINGLGYIVCGNGTSQCWEYNPL
jgi:N-acetylneuraminic acid mutarotase